MNTSEVIGLVEKHKGLGDKSLSKVWEWAEENEETSPLAKAYCASCYAIGVLDSSAICQELETHWRGKNYGYIREAYKPYDFAFLYRDTIGRIILDMMKRQENKK